MYKNKGFSYFYTSPKNFPTFAYIISKIRPCARDIWGFSGREWFREILVTLQDLVTQWPSSAVGIFVCGEECGGGGGITPSAPRFLRLPGLRACTGMQNSVRYLCLLCSYSLCHTFSLVPCNTMFGSTHSMVSLVSNTIY